MLPGLIEELTDAVASAAGYWALGDPENPGVRIVLESLLQILWARHVTPYPPSKQFPLGI